MEQTLPKLGEVIEFTEQNGSKVAAIVCGYGKFKKKTDGTFQGGNGPTTMASHNATFEYKDSRVVMEERPVVWVFTMERAQPYTAVI